MKPVFSLIHATARLPLGWWPAAEKWLSLARRFGLADGSIEYIVCVDSADAVKLPLDKVPDGFKVVVNMGRPCAVDAWNVAAAEATGSILITVADDWYPCENWDGLLFDLLEAEAVKSHAELAELERAVWLATGGNLELMQFSVLTRAYYERYGRVYFPDYIGMYADNDFQAQCLADGVLIDARQTLPMFPHFHPAMGTADMDEIYMRQNRTEAYALGSKIFAERWPEAWRRLHPGRAPHTGDGRAKRVIAVCLPGCEFSAPWVCAWTELLPHLVGRGFGVIPSIAYTSNCYITRAGMWFDLQNNPSVPELVLWIDHDNIITREVFDRLLNAMDNGPADCDVVAAWTWIQDDLSAEGVKVSCGRLDESGAEVQTVPVSQMKDLNGLLKVEWTGFACVLMRYSILERASAAAAKRNGVFNPFCPIPAPNTQWGHTGEDIAFCTNVGDAGGSIYVDTNAFVHHLKLRPLGARLKVAAEAPEAVKV